MMDLDVGSKSYGEWIVVAVYLWWISMKTSNDIRCETFHTKDILPSDEKR